MEITEVVLTAAAAESAEKMNADAAMKEMTVDAVITTQITDAVMTAQIMAAVTAVQSSVLNPGLNKGPLCSIRIQDVDVKNPRITAVTVNSNENIFYENVRENPAHFLVKNEFLCTCLF